MNNRKNEERLLNDTWLTDSSGDIVFLKYAQFTCPNCNRTWGVNFTLGKYPHQMGYCSECGTKAVVASVQR